MFIKIRLLLLKKTVPALSVSLCVCVREMMIKGKVRPNMTIQSLSAYLHADGKVG